MSADVLHVQINGHGQPLKSWCSDMKPDIYTKKEGIDLMKRVASAHDEADCQGTVSACDGGPMTLPDGKVNRDKIEARVSGSGMNNELNRLETFKDWPESCPVPPSYLARAGFYYTGVRDAVKCFSCGGQIEGWEYGDTAMGEHKRLFKTCAFANERITPNVPLLEMNERPEVAKKISSKIEQSQRDIERRAKEKEAMIERVEPSEPKRDLVRSSASSSSSAAKDEKMEEEEEGPSMFGEYYKEHMRLQSFKNWPRTSPIEPRDLAKAGFYYLNNDDSVQCFACFGQISRWKPCDVPAVEHKTHFPNCPYVQGLDVGNLPISTPPAMHAGMPPPIRSYSTPMPTHDQLRAGQFLQQQRSLRAQMGPLNNCKHPNFVQENARLGTFRNWPGNPGLHVIPRILAKAGFYFTGLVDECKCFYCDGGLKNWEPTDEPWTEHAKWFPRCEWLIQQRGQAFIAHVQQVNPPPIGTPAPLHFTAPTFSGTEEPYSHVEPPYRFQASYQERHRQASSKPSPPLNKSKQEMMIEEEKAAALREYESKHKEPEVAAAINFRPKPKKLETTEPSNAICLDVGNLPISTPPVMPVGMSPPIWSYSTPMPTQDQLRAGQFLQQQRSLWAQMGPLNNCKYPNFVQENARLGTFRNWPGNPGLHVTPQILTSAGLKHFTGLGDECKCFYCDRGVENWEPTNETLMEHAKWFPRCEWQKWQAFIAYVQQVNPPPISTPPLHFTAPNLGAEELYSQVDPSHSFQASYQERHRQASSKLSTPLNRSKQEMMIEEEKTAALREYESKHKEPEVAAAINFRPKPKKLETTEPSNAISSIDDFMQSPTAEMAIEMGYHTDLIRYVVKQHFKKTGRQFSTPDELLDSIWEAEGQGVDLTPGVGEASGGHDVDYLRKLPKELESESVSVTLSHIIDIQAEKLARLSISDEPRQRMNSSPRTVAPVTPIGSLKPQISVSSGSSDPSYQDKQLCKICLEKELSTAFLPSVSSGSSDPSYQDKQLCKICLEKELSTAFLPCKHLATCSECAARVTECPICRQPIVDFLTIYMP